MVRGKVSSVVFQIFFCFCLIQGTAGDSSSQTDTNTIVGKPKLGKKGLLDTLFHRRHVFFCLSMARPLINSLILKTSCKIYVQGKSSVQPPGGEVLGIDEPLKV